MSIERCTDCGREVDTDYEEVTYYENKNPVEVVCDSCEVVRKLKREEECEKTKAKNISYNSRLTNMFKPKEEE